MVNENKIKYEILQEKIAKSSEPQISIVIAPMKKISTQIDYSRDTENN